MTTLRVVSFCLRLFLKLVINYQAMSQVIVLIIVLAERYRNLKFVIRIFLQFEYHLLVLFI
jgi:hypothetical protein